MSARSYYGVKSGARIPHPIEPSAWNPLDFITSQILPPCVDLTEGNRLATRNTVLPDHWEAGVRGVQSRGGSGRWYLELEVVSIGNGLDSANQGMQFGLIDARATNILSRPPASDNSVIANLIVPVANYVMAYTRLDGCIFSNQPSNPTLVGAFGNQPGIGDVFGFDWLVGTSITVTRNGGSAIAIPFTPTVNLFPYFSAGATLVDGSNLGSTEACRIRTGHSQQSYKPTGATSWG